MRVCLCACDSCNMAYRNESWNQLKSHHFFFIFQKNVLFLVFPADIHFPSHRSFTHFFIPNHFHFTIFTLLHCSHAACCFFPPSTGVGVQLRCDIERRKTDSLAESSVMEMEWNQELLLRCLMIARIDDVSELTWEDVWLKLDSRCLSDCTSHLQYCLEQFPLSYHPFRFGV